MTGENIGLVCKNSLHVWSLFRYQIRRIITKISQSLDVAGFAFKSPMALAFDWRLDSTAAEVFVVCQSDTII